MSTKGCTKESKSDQVKLDFLDVLNFFKTTVQSTWWYGVKLDQSNHHSLAAAVGLKTEEVLSILELFGLCRKHGKTIVVKRDVMDWACATGLNKFFHCNETVNYSTSRCTLSKKQHVFVRLGGSKSDTVSILYPSLQHHTDTTPVEQLPLPDQRILRGYGIHCRRVFGFGWNTMEK